MARDPRETIKALQSLADDERATPGERQAARDGIKRLTKDLEQSRKRQLCHICYLDYILLEDTMKLLVGPDPDAPELGSAGQCDECGRIIHPLFQFAAERLIADGTLRDIMTNPYGRRTKRNGP